MGPHLGSPLEGLSGSRGPARSRRQLLLDAIADVVSECGYQGASVSRVVAAAGVSRNVFYEHFANKEECFLAAYDESVEEAMRLIRAAAAGDGDPWERRLEAGVAAFLAHAAARPARAWLCIVEALAAGPRALARRDAALRAFAAALDRCRDGAAAQAPSLMTEVAAGGIYEILYARILAGRTASLPELLPDVMYVWLAPLAGPERAAATARAAARRQAGAAAGPARLALAVERQDTDVS